MSDSVRQYNREWYHNQSPEWKARKRKRSSDRHDRIYSFVADYKRAHGCVKCDETEPVALDFHHIKDKELEVSNAVRAGWAEARLLAEMEKCVVICSNCHRKVHAGIIKI